MDDMRLPRVVEPEVLKKHLGESALVIVDLSRPETYAQAHVPGAISVDYRRIVAARPPAMGMLPDAATLSELFGSLGLTPATHVVAYDDEGGGRASRFLWTLDAVGHQRHSLLNGGLHAWLNDRHPVSRDAASATPSQYPVTFNSSVVADKTYILQHLKDPGVVILDARTAAEYRGDTKRAERTGHIPGAVNFDWMNAIDQARSVRLKPAEELKKSLESLGVTPDKEIITYCQTHHRSAHTYIVLKNLGFTRVRGYPGSWSEWGNSTDTPIE